MKCTLYLLQTLIVCIFASGNFSLYSDDRRPEQLTPITTSQFPITRKLRAVLAYVVDKEYPSADTITQRGESPCNCLTHCLRRMRTRFAPPGARRNEE